MPVVEQEVNALAIEGYVPAHMSIAGGSIISALIIIFKYDPDRRIDGGASETSG